MKAVILAAGASSRFWPIRADSHKSLTSICGKPLIQWTIDELDRSPVDQVIIVEGPGKPISKTIDAQTVDIAVDFVIQDQPHGMGHALKQAEPFLEGAFLVMTPYRKNAASFIQQMIDKKEQTDCDGVLLSTPTATPSTYGVLETAADQAVNIVEKPEPENAPSNDRIVGIYLLPPTFFIHLTSVEQHEYQYEDALAELMEAGNVRVVETSKETGSIKYPWDLFDLTDQLIKAQEARIDPEATVKDNATVEGHVIVEEGAQVYENAVIRGPAYIGENSVIGNSAVVRAGTVVEADCTVGAFSEVRNSILQPGVSLHDTFLGDSIVDRNSSFGAGTVVANRLHRDEDGDRPTISVTMEHRDETIDTGRDRLGTMVGKDVQIGTQCNIMPGVQIGSASIIGPSTPVFENVKTNKRYFAKADIVEKDR